MAKVYGKSVLIFGDIHFSDIFKGRHINYLKNCFNCLGKIEKQVIEEKPCAVILLGDLVGVNEGNIHNREVLNMFCKWLKRIKEVCLVFVIRGNHDFKGSFPEFQFLSELDLIKTSTDCEGYLDFYGDESQESPEVRFHLVDYGTEERELNIHTNKEVTNIVLAHNNFTIQGLTNWYQEHDGIELGVQQNFANVYMVISGHIHNPSPEIISTETVSGENCLLFYPGCPTRPSYEKNMYKSVWSVRFAYDSATKTTNYNALEFELPPIEETFIVDDNFIEDKTEEQIAEIERTEALKDVLDDILKCRMTSGDLVGQVRMIPNASEEAKNMAIDYLQVAIDSKKQS